VRRALSEGVGFETALSAFCGTEWIAPAAQSQSLLRRDGSESGLTYEAIPLPGKPPRFMKSRTATDAGNVVGYRITDNKTGGRLLFLPDISVLSENLLRLLPECDALLFDGTFWSENEMREQGVGTLSAADMGHVPISGAAGSLKVLAELRLKHKIYTHINNTNPVLIEGSAERAAVETARCAVGQDGMEFEI
jgi:pyrroloquinoline quinone biosynthesis protein B